ncbi:hypothetical protein B0H16DRAFT_710828 [Mycena metata]|uniref:Uncharacterized protein n=1 Tax=Mycena metata TaxID=1033252 RepID=A0AAD7GT44_9AGAR|nr:hypothetical protein B0H16DRAFT_710828 [Mycena metata]
MPDNEGEHEERLGTVRFGNKVRAPACHLILSSHYTPRCDYVHGRGNVSAAWWETESEVGCVSYLLLFSTFYFSLIRLPTLFPIVCALTYVLLVFVDLATPPSCMHPSRAPGARSRLHWCTRCPCPVPNAEKVAFPPARRSLPQRARTCSRALAPLSSSQAAPHCLLLLLSQPSPYAHAYSDTDPLPRIETQCSFRLCRLVLSPADSG